MRSRMRRGWRIAPSSCGGRPATILADLPLDGAPATRTAADMARLVSALAATN